MLLNYLTELVWFIWSHHRPLPTTNDRN